MAGRFRFIALGVVVIGLALGVVFGLGVKYGQGKEPEAQQGVTLQQIQQMIGSGGGGGGAGGAGAGGAGAGGGGAGAGGGGSQASNGGANSALASGRATAGRITAVQGQTVTIELRPGVTQKINLGAQSVVNKSSTGAGADLKEGSNVIITGTRKEDGSFDAATINLVAPELAQILSGGTAAGGASSSPAPMTTPAAPAPAAPAAPAPGR